MLSWAKAHLWYSWGVINILAYNLNKAFTVLFFPPILLQGGRGSSSHKAGMSKVSKQLALAFAKRTVARCHKFEEMGRSCFSEPPFRDLILNPPTTDPKYFEGITSWS